MLKVKSVEVQPFHGPVLICVQVFLYISDDSHSVLDIVHENLKMGSDGESDQASGTSSDEVQSPTGVCLRNRVHRRISMEVTNERTCTHWQNNGKNGWHRHILLFNFSLVLLYSSPPPSPLSSSPNGSSVSGGVGSRARIAVPSPWRPQQWLVKGCSVIICAVTTVIFYMSGVSAGTGVFFVPLEKMYIIKSCQLKSCCHFNACSTSEHEPHFDNISFPGFVCIFRAADTNLF